MAWIQLEISASPAELEILTGLLPALGAAGTFEKDGQTVIGYFETDNPEETVRNAEQYLEALNMAGCRIVMTEVKQQAWHLMWQDNFKPIQLTDKIGIFPEWLADSADCDIPLIIRPGMAFGTGTHETTQMALQLVEKYLIAASRVLDAGSGTGILAMAALRLGAAAVDCWDIDHDVVDNFNENMELNHIGEGFTLTIGDVTLLPDYPWDFVVSNIQKTPNLALLASLCLANCPAPVIFTGILDTEKQEFSNALESKNYQIIDIIGAGEWVAFYAKPA